MNVSNASKIASAALVTGTLLGALVGIVPAAAQQPPWQADQAPPPPKAAPKAVPKPAAQPKAAPAAPKEDTGAAAARGADPALRQRIEQLEEQLADMQVTMGTLESLGKVGGTQASATQPARGGASGGAMDNARIDSLETQIRALTDQVEQLQTQLRRRSDLGPQGNPGPAPRTDTAQAPAAIGGFGNITVTPGPAGNDPIGRMIDPPGGTSPGAARQAAALPTAAQAAGGPKELYETAYGYLLQQDYGGAEVTFEEFIRRYPNDRQAADAQYWYGETLYVQRRYKPAAQAFLKVIDTYPQSAKAPNGILKLAMTLEQLGQKDCGLFTDLDTRHPNAPADVKSKARALKQRVGC